MDVAGWRIDALKTTLIVALTLALSACPSAKRGTFKERAAAIDDIGVVSLLGNTFHGVYVGTMVFSNKYFSADVTEWNIDSIAEQAAVSELTKLGRYRVGAVDRGAEAVKTFYKKGSSTEIDYPRLLKLVASNGYGTAFIVRPMFYSNMPQHRPGYGLIEQSVFNLTNKCVYSLFMVEVYDVATGRELGDKFIEPCMTGEKELSWKPDFGKYSEAQKAMLRQKTEESVRSNIVAGILKMRLFNPDAGQKKNRK